jgi:hypothetical protein
VDQYIRGPEARTSRFSDLTLLLFSLQGFVNGQGTQDILKCRV